VFDQEKEYTRVPSLHRRERVFPPNEAMEGLTHSVYHVFSNDFVGFWAIMGDFEDDLRLVGVLSKNRTTT
jgi:hypothetical protein